MRVSFFFFAKMLSDNFRYFYFRAKSKSLLRFKITLILILFGIFVKADIFTSTADMNRLLNGEINVVDAVREYVAIESKRHKLLYEMAENYEEECRQWTQQIDGRFLSNPVAAYLIIKRLATGWIEIERTMRSNYADDVISHVTRYDYEKRVLAPNQTDVEGAAVALMRLQSTYQIETSIMANGYLPGVSHFSSMSAKDCFDVGIIALKSEDDYYAISWFQEALDRHRSEQPSPTKSEISILENYAPVLFRQQNYVRAFYLTKRLSELRPDHNETSEILQIYEAEVLENGQGHHLIGNQSENEIDWPPLEIQRNISAYTDENYEALCRGEGNMVQTNGLYCYYKTDSPYLRLAPFKTEIVNVKPEILVFRDVISIDEVKTIKELATRLLSRSEVGESGNSQVADYRISKNTWLNDDLHPTVQLLTHRVARMTGLDMEYVEPCQIANYGIGGHYEEHHDCGLHYKTLEDQENAAEERWDRVQDEDDDDDEKSSYDTEDRIATVMFYLTQPVAGGATVFPRLNLTLFPTAGDAVFWYNMRKNGLADTDVLHAACPVLTGEKWVLNKWISVLNQELIRICGLSAND